MQQQVQPEAIHITNSRHNQANFAKYARMLSTHSPEANTKFACFVTQAQQCALCGCANLAIDPLIRYIVSEHVQTT